MKILLISTNTATSPYPVFPLGCGIIASVLRDAGHNVRLFDVMVESDGIHTFDKICDSLMKEARSFNPELVGISIRNIDNVNILEEKSFLDIPKKIISAIRGLKSSIPIMMGGSGFSIIPDEILNFTGADYGIVGEGEQLVLELVRQLADGTPPSERVIYSTGKGLIGDEIKGSNYFSDTKVTTKPLSAYYRGTGSILPIQTKRGCLNNCVYCTYPFLEGRTLRSRTPEDVVSEMKILKEEHGADFIFFTDSVFNDADGEYLKIIEAIEKSGIDIPWTAFFQPDPKLNGETADRLIAAGLHSVELGPDATSDTTLKAIGKKFNFHDVIKCNELFADRHIAVANYFMMGGPGETQESAVEGVENITKLDMSVSFVFLGIRILPGTPLYKIAIRENIITEKTSLLSPVYYFSPKLNRDWLENYLDSTLSRIKHCVYPPNSMDSGIQILRKMGYRGNLWEMMVKGSKRLKKADTE
jgi:radical SAM superfamily enzyme YgiQ (UPF0313 family)